MSCMLHRTESIFRQLAARRSDIIRQGQGSKCGAWGPICSVLRRPLIEGIEIGVAVVRHQPVASPQTNLRGFAHTPKQHRLVQKSFLVGIFTWSKNRTLPNRDQSINQSINQSIMGYCHGPGSDLLPSSVPQAPRRCPGGSSQPDQGRLKKTPPFSQLFLMFVPSLSWLK